MEKSALPAFGCRWIFLFRILSSNSENDLTLLSRRFDLLVVGAEIVRWIFVFRRVDPCADCCVRDLLSHFAYEI